MADVSTMTTRKGLWVVGSEGVLKKKKKGYFILDIGETDNAILIATSDRN